EATSILPSLNGKTARSWRGIVPFTHLAREGRMAITIGRRELLVALGGAAAAWPFVARRSRRRSCQRPVSWAPSRSPPRAPGLPHSSGACASMGGSKAAPSRSSIAGQRETQRALRRNRGSRNPPAMFIVESYRPEVDHDHSTSLFFSLLFSSLL